MVAMWSDEPNKQTCEDLGNGLIALADSGDKKAAALYFLIAAYDNNAGGFSKDTACRLVFELDAMEEYRELLREELIDYTFDDDFNELYAFPVIHTFRKLTEESGSGEDEKI